MLKRLNNLVLKAEIILSIAMMATISVIVMLQVFCRFALRSPLSWPEELSLFLLPWIVFTGTSILLKQGGHISVSVFVNTLPPVVRSVIAILVDLILIYILVILIIYGTSSFYLQSVASTINLGIPKGYFTLPQVIFSFSMILYMIETLHGKIMNLASMLRNLKRGCI